MSARHLFGPLALVVALAGVLEASSFTPLEWQQRVEKHSIASMVSQRKHLTWVRDQNRNFIDDEIEKRFKPGELVNVIVDLNTCLPEESIRRLLGQFGRVRHIGRLITMVLLDDVRYEALPRIAELAEVAMIEWQEPLYITDDVSGRAVQARSSVTFSPNTAQDLGFDGTGVVVAIVDTGVDDAHESLAGKFVAGFDATTGTAGNPVDGNGHGTHVAGIAIGAGTPGRVCRTPSDGSPTNCAGVAAGARLVEVKVCDSSGMCPFLAQGLDWLGMNATALNVRAANVSIGGCTDDDGTSALAQQVNYLTSIGVFMALSAGNASNCAVVPGTKLVGSPASSSFAMTVAGTNTSLTVNRSDDTIFSGFMIGPRMDFNLVTPNLLALKPDISAPGQNIFAAQVGTTSSYVSKSGTSMASPHVAGAGAVIVQARPGITPDSLKDLLKRTADTSKNTIAFPTADPVWDSSFGEGMMNLFAAAAAAGATDVKFPTCIGPPATAGQPCQLSGGLPSWNNNVDLSTAAAPQVGVANTIIAQVRNNGPATATVQVNFGVYVFGAGTNQFFHVGTQQVTIPPMTTIAVNQPWTPAAANHQCAQVSIAFGLDTDYGNNVTQRNLQVAPSVFEVRVENPFMVPAQFRIELKSKRDNWQCRVSEEKFTLGPFECPRDLKVTYHAPKEARPGDRADCDVAIFATPTQGDGRERLIGGVTVQTFVPKPCLHVAAVEDPKGIPVPRLRVMFTRRPMEEHSPFAESPPTNVVTGAGGIFNINLPPFSEWEVAVLSPRGAITAKTIIHPGCDGYVMHFVYDGQTLKLAGR